MIARLLPTTSTAARTIDKGSSLPPRLGANPITLGRGRCSFGRRLFHWNATWRGSVAGSLPRRDERCCVPLAAFPQRQPLGLPAAPSPGSALAGAVFLGGNVSEQWPSVPLTQIKKKDGLVNGGPLLGQLFSAFARQHCPGFRHILQLFLMNLVPLDSQSHFAALGSVIFVFRCFSHGRDPNNHGQKNVNPNNPD